MTGERHAMCESAFKAFVSSVKISTVKVIYIYACTVKPYDILEVKNALANSMYYVTECNCHILVEYCGCHTSIHLNYGQ